MSPEPLAMPMQQALTGDVFASIHEHDDPRLIYEAAGQSVFAIREATTIERQMQTLMDEISVAATRLRSMSRTAD